MLEDIAGVSSSGAGTVFSLKRDIKPNQKIFLEISQLVQDYFSFGFETFYYENVENVTLKMRKPTRFDIEGDYVDKNVTRNGKPLKNKLKLGYLDIREFDHTSVGVVFFMRNRYTLFIDIESIYDEVIAREQAKSFSDYVNQRRVHANPMPHVSAEKFS